MEDKMEMRVLAIGQGSCGLVAYRNSFGQLVQLDLCDCGRTSGMHREVVQMQMQTIRDLMGERAAVYEGGASYYLDNVIISHLDTDHLNLFTNTYFFKDREPDPEVDRELQRGWLERKRVVPLFPEKEPGEGQDDLEQPAVCAEFLNLYVSYVQEEGKPVPLKARVEHKHNHKISGTPLISTLSYDQSFSMEDGGRPFRERPLSYSSYGGIYDPKSAERKLGHFSHTMNTSLENGCIFWRVYGCCRSRWGSSFVSFELKFWRFSDTNQDSVVFNCGTHSDDLPRGFSLPFKPPTISPDKDLAFLAALNGYTKDVFKWLIEEGFKKLFPCEDPEPIFENLRKLLNYYNRSFQKMKGLLEERLQRFARFSGSAICKTVFGADGQAAPRDGYTMAVGNIYLGGSGYPSSTGIADRAISQLETFCPNQPRILPGGVQNEGRMALMQMPNRHPFIVPCVNSRGISDYCRVTAYAGENDRSIMYIAIHKGNGQAIFPGDATGLTMQYFLGILPKLGVTLCDTWLAAPHHGAWDTCKSVDQIGAPSPLERYLECLSPYVLFISAGPNNRYGHPRSEFLKFPFERMPKDAEPHIFNYYNTARGRWDSSDIRQRIYSTVSQERDGQLCYVDLSMNTDMTEPDIRVVGPIRTRRLGLAEHEQAEPVPGAHQFPGDAFPFLFDEPSAMGGFAL